MASRYLLEGTTARRPGATTEDGDIYPDHSIDCLSEREEEEEESYRREAEIPLFHDATTSQCIKALLLEDSLVKESKAFLTVGKGRSPNLYYIIA
jgi:hypothetical protein